MSTSANSSLDLDDTVPQWKKDLILRKRAQQGLNKPGLQTVQHQQQQQLGNGNTQPVDCTTSTPTSTVHSSVIAALATTQRCTEGAPLLSNGAASGTQNQTAQLTNPATYTPVSYNVSPNKSSVIVGNTNLNGKVNEQCNKKFETNCALNTVIKEVKMVQDSVLVMRPPLTTNGDCCKKITNGDGSDSDTSEELQYGPGIVSKLKSKYLSLTLREATIKSRPSILSMRRATSLENLLDAEDSGDETQQNTTEHNVNGRRATVSSGVDNGAARRYAPRTNYERNGQGRNQQNRYRNSNRGNDSQKRARSVETLVRSQSDPSDVTNGELINGNDTTTIRKPMFDNAKKPEINNKFASSCNGAGQRINRPKRIAPIMDETERPPADLVKQTLMIFEGPAVRRTKAPRSTGDVAAKVANFKNIIDQEKQNNNTSSAVVITNNNGKKLGPKPHITGPKPVIVSKRGSPVKRPLTPTNSTEKQRIDSPELIKSPPQTPPISPQKSRPSPIPDVSRDTTFQETENRNTTLSETPDLIAHSSPARVFSPTTVKTITENFIKEEAKSSDGKSEKCGKISDTRDKVKSRSPSPRIVPEKEKEKETEQVKEKEVVDGEEKAVTKQSLENISNAGVTVTYRFNNNDSQLAKSHLPRLNTIPVRINRLVPDVPSPKPSPVVTPVKLNGTTPPPVPTRTSSSPAIIPRVPAPLAQIAPSIPLPTSPEPAVVASPAVHSSPSIVSATNKNISKTRPSPATPAVQPSNQKNLSPREIEKNTINKQKTLEQPISKVVVSMRSVDEVVANKTLSGGVKKSARHNEQTTILFNFQQRDTIPDYISTDGSTNTRRGKREKPKPGENGIILLPGAPAEEFADDDEDWMLSLNGPPSPCDVHFENDNILIDGKSNISKQPKRQKMRIQFDDDATQIFEYLSESSMIDEMAPQQNTTGHSVPSLSGSSLASYTPSKMSMTSDFQLGVTRTSQPIMSPPSVSPNQIQSPNNGIEPETLQPVTYSAETNADILF